MIRGWILVTYGGPAACAGIGAHRGRWRRCAHEDLDEDLAQNMTELACARPRLPCAGAAYGPPPLVEGRRGLGEVSS